MGERQGEEAVARAFVALDAVDVHVLIAAGRHHRRQPEPVRLSGVRLVNDVQPVVAESDVDVAVRRPVQQVQMTQLSQRLRTPTRRRAVAYFIHSDEQDITKQMQINILTNYFRGWLGRRVVTVLHSGAEGTGFKSQPRRCRVTVLGKLFTPIVTLFTKQRNW